MYTAQVNDYISGGKVIYKPDEEGFDTDKVLRTLEEGHPGAIYIHYLGYDDDKWVELTEECINPLGAHKKSVTALDRYLKGKKKKQCLSSNDNERSLAGKLKHRQ